MKNLNSSSDKASDMVPELYVGPISANFLFILTGYYSSDITERNV